MTNNDKLTLRTFSLLGLVFGFMAGYLILDRVVSGVILGVGLGLAFAASIKAVHSKE